MSFEQLLLAGESQALEFKTSFDKATIESLGKCRISPATSFRRRPESSVFNPDSSLAPDRATKQHPPLWKRGARGDLNFFRVQKSPSVSFCIPNYTDGSDIQIKIFDHKISIFSPGTFYGGISVADIQADNYRSRLRNKLVAEGFYLTGNIEKYGSGFIRIRKALRDYPEIDIEVKEFAGGVMAMFARREGSSGGVNGLLAYIQTHPGQRASEMAIAFELSRRTIERGLKQLKDNQLIEYCGAPKTGGYFPKGH